MTDSQVLAPWATVNDLVGDCASTPIGENELNAALLMASNMLYRATRRRWRGVTTDVVRPITACDCWIPWGYGTAGSGSFEITPGYGFDFGYAQLYPDGLLIGSRLWPSGRMGCQPMPRVELNAPVRALTKVLVDGVDVTGVCAVENGNELVRTDGGSFPCCQDSRRPATEQGTFEVTYTFGQLPPADGVVACAVLACALAKQLGPTEPGLRPVSNVSATTREGVSRQRVLPGLDKDGRWRCGIPLVDLWVASIDDEGAQAETVVMGVRQWERTRANRRTL